MDEEKMAAMTTFTDSTPTTKHNVADIILNITQEPDPSTCLVIEFEGVAPWYDPGNLVSAVVEDIVHRVTTTVVLPISFLIGGPANVINMAVFYKQGLKERINVCLFSLSLVDFLYLFFNMILYVEKIHLQFASLFTVNEKYGSVMLFLINYNLVGFYGFSWSSQIISAIIASERCFCIMWPLRSQTVMSTSTTTIIIVIVNIIMVGLYSVVVTRYRGMCVHDPITDLDTWTLVPSQFYYDHQQLVDFLDGYIFGVAVPVVMIAVVMVTTIVTMIKLRQAAAWRAGTSSSSSVSAREMALTVMLVYNSIFFVICVFPVALLRLICLFIPDLNTGRRQHNLYLMSLWLLSNLTYFNAAFNIVVYYTMGSRYRQTFWQLVGRDRNTHKVKNTAVDRSKTTPQPL